MPHRPRPEGKVRRWLPRGLTHIGKRGQILLVCGLLWTVVGYSTIDSQMYSAELPHTWVDPTLRGYLWIMSGVLATFIAFRPPGLSDAFGFLALYAMPATRVASYAYAWINSWEWLPISGPGIDDAWKTLVIYTAMVAMVMITASWPEPPYVPVRLRHRGDEDDEEKYA
jgi:hypothetical protein